MPMYNLLEYSNNYSKLTWSLWQYYKDDPFLDDHDTNADFNNSASFTYKQKTGKFVAAGTKDVNIMVLLRYLSNFWNAVTLETSLINCQINLILTWSDKFQQ